jgi:dihydroneopterin aldolase
MFTVRLNDMIFHAYHGVHEEETVVGTDFKVSVLISFSKSKKILSLNDTINYVSVFEIVKKLFEIPEKLLETLAQNITDEIYKINNQISSINVTIDKLNPPIRNFTGTVGVNYLKFYA